MSSIYYFYKNNPPEEATISTVMSVPFYRPDFERPIGTYKYVPNDYYVWTRLIETKKGKVYAKVALRNVPKKFKAMLLLMGVSYPT